MAASPAPATSAPPRTCVNCRAQMRWVGHFNLRTFGFTGSVDFLTGSTSSPAETVLPFSLYYCQGCGKFDFYYPGT